MSLKYPIYYKHVCCGMYCPAENQPFQKRRKINHLSSHNLKISLGRLVGSKEHEKCLGEGVGAMLMVKSA